MEPVINYHPSIQVFYKMADSGEKKVISRGGVSW